MRKILQNVPEIPQISKHGVTQHSFCLVAIDFYLRFCASIYHQKILRLSFWRYRDTYTSTTWTQKDMKMAPSKRKLSNFFLYSDCQSNTKIIRVILRLGPSRDFVVELTGLLVVVFQRWDSLTQSKKGTMKVLKICKKFH